MINYYQPFLLPFLKPTSYRIPDRLRRTYFLSFEDGLWVLLKKMNIPLGSIILVPDFYCMDVVDNIRTHGYVPVFYPLDDQLQISAHTLNQYVGKNKPSVTILFHACGITRISRAAIRSLCTSFPDMLVIEDAVQKLIDPETVTLEHPHHFLMDSLRKVSPIPGSFLYQQNNALRVSPDVVRNEWRYSLSVHGTFWLFRTLFVLGTLLRSASLVRYAHEKTLRTHDDIVGDSDGGYTGMTFMSHVHEYFDFKKIQQLKLGQTLLYEKYLQNMLTEHPMWYRIRIPEQQKKDLHVFPIGIKTPDAKVICKHIESYLYTRGIVVWFKFPDSPWCDDRGILFLPLGFHISKKSITYIMNALQDLPRFVPAE